MSPRPRKVSDEDIFAATYRAMTRLGPGELTLAEIATEAGVTAGALVQRFGSKRQLLLALSTRAADSGADFFTSLRAEYRSPLAALRAYGDCLAQMAESPAALARSLAYLQIDLTDEDFRRPLAIHARTTRAGLGSLIEEAVAAGELLPNANPASLARSIEAVLSGSMMTWAMYLEGTAAQWMRDDLDAILLPYVSKKTSRRRPG
ncbi:MAG: TetR/AcrR family transcriptional regulator [Gemmatimonadaceae bacterium]